MTALCSFSGGKDSCLALHMACEQGIRVSHLLTMLHEEGRFSRSHGISVELLQAQATALNRKLLVGKATWDEYEKVFVEQLNLLKAKGLSQAVFGDIDLQEHRDWEEKVCQIAGLQALLPLWKKDRPALVEEFFKLKYRATIVAVRGDQMLHWLGRELCPDFVREAQSIGWDACGEGGEYHTFVFDGPLFNHPVNYRLAETVVVDDCSICRLQN